MSPMIGLSHTHSLDSVVRMGTVKKKTKMLMELHNNWFYLVFYDHMPLKYGLSLTVEILAYK